jgi:hypothetical protein
MLDQVVSDEASRAGDQNLRAQEDPSFYATVYVE